MILIPTALGWLPPLVGITVAGLFVLASEIFGRYLFYGSYVRLGL